MAKQLDWKIRMLIIVAGIFIMMLGQSSLLWILIGMAVTFVGIYYGTKDKILAYFKKKINKLWQYIRSYLPPFL